MELAARGPLTLPVLVQRCKMSGRHVREALLVLIHHNLAQYRQATGMAEQMATPSTGYHLDLEAVILRLCFPLCALLVEERFGPDTAKTFMEVLKHGRLPLSSSNRQVDRSLLEKLVNEGFLEVLAVQSTSAAAIPSTAFANSNPTGSPSSGRKKRPAPVSPSALTTEGQQGKRGKVEEDGGDGEGQSTSFVRVALKSFLLALWQQSMVDYASRRVNQAAGIVMRAALRMDHTRASEKGLPFNASQLAMRLPPGTILPIEYPADYQHHPFHQNSNQQHSSLSQYLECLWQEVDFFTKSDSHAGGHYLVDWRMASTRLRTDLAEAFVMARFGQGSARIFRVLWHNKMLEERTISKIAMMGAKETRERLYQLLRYGLVHLQEVPKTVDHAPSRTFYLWTVPLPALFDDMANAALKMLSNLIERTMHERKRHELLILKSQRSDVISNPALLSEAERRQLTSLQRTLDRLSSQILRIIREYLILCHFEIKGEI